MNGLVRLFRSMYNNVHSKVRFTTCYSKPINVFLGVHQGSVLGLVLFIIVIEPLSREFRIGCPEELSYANDIVIVT